MSKASSSPVFTQIVYVTKLLGFCHEEDVLRLLQLRLVNKAFAESVEEYSHDAWKYFATTQLREIVEIEHKSRYKNRRQLPPVATTSSSSSSSRRRPTELNEKQKRLRHLIGLVTFPDRRSSRPAAGSPPLGWNQWFVLRTVLVEQQPKQEQQEEAATATIEKEMVAVNAFLDALFVRGGFDPADFFMPSSNNVSKKSKTPFSTFAEFVQYHIMDSSLHLCGEKHAVPCLRAFLMAGYPVNGTTPIYFHGECLYFEELPEDDDDEGSNDRAQLTLLMRAMHAFTNVEMIKMLLVEFGADPNIVVAPMNAPHDMQHTTALAELSGAASANTGDNGAAAIAVATLLLQHGAKPMVAFREEPRFPGDRCHVNILMKGICTTEFCPHLLRFFLSLEGVDPNYATPPRTSTDAGFLPIMAAIERRNVGCVRVLLDDPRTDLNMPRAHASFGPMSPLRLVCIMQPGEGSEQMLAMMLEKVAAGRLDVNLRSGNSHFSALDQMIASSPHRGAADRQLPDRMVRRLIDAGAKCCWSDDDDNSNTGNTTAFSCIRNNSGKLSVLAENREWRREIIALIRSRE